MRKLQKSGVFDRRRFLAGAGVALTNPGRIRAQTTTPLPTPAPVRIQTPDLAFAGALQVALENWSNANAVDDLWLSIVPAEPASDSLLNDARSGLQRFSGAFVPNWTIPDLVRDRFILPAPPPTAALPPAIAQLRSLGGEWVATDLDHDGDLLYFRMDLLSELGFDPAESWSDLLDQIRALADRGLGGIGLPMTHGQQVVDHFTAMAASFVLGSNTEAPFWFDSETMTPAIASEHHRQALEAWRTLGQSIPAALRNGSTGDLWLAFIDGRVTYLIASADFLPFALGRGLDSDLIGVSQLPGTIGDDGTVQRAGNVAGASWGGVVMRAASDHARSEVTSFLTSLADPYTQQILWSDPSTGITPAPASAADVVKLTTALTNAGWPERAASDWLNALYETFANPVQLPALRIAETRRYLQALEDRIVPFLAPGSTASAAETLLAASEDWAHINAAIGLDTQHALFEQSHMPPPEAR